MKLTLCTLAHFEMDSKGATCASAVRSRCWWDGAILAALSANTPGRTMDALARTKTASIGTCCDFSPT
jgi:hypothetical protein